MQWRTVSTRPSLAYSANLGVRVPDYEINRVLWLDDHFEGGALFQDALQVELVPPTAVYGGWRVRTGWLSGGGVGPNTPTVPLQVTQTGWQLATGFANLNSPGISGALRFDISLRN